MRTRAYAQFFWQNRHKSLVDFLQQCAQKRQPKAEKTDKLDFLSRFLREKSTGEFSAFQDQMRQSRIC
jgi:hypothetical protein